MTTAILVLTRTLHIGSAMMLFALPYFMLFILRPTFSGKTIESHASFCQKMMRWLGIALIVEAVSGAIWFWFVAAQISSQSPSSILVAANLNAVLWQTGFGHLWLLRGMIGIALGLALYFASRKGTLLPPRPSPLNWLVVSVGACLLVTLAWAGHVAAGLHHQILHLLADTPHLLVGAIWPVGLIPMAYFLWHINRGNRPVPADREIETLQRFSQSSLIAVFILLVTGSINGWLMIGSWENLVTTTYGRLFLCKMLVVAIMIAMGAFNRLRLLPRIHDVSKMFSTLRTTVVAESCLGLVVLFIVGMHT
jgi:putative copper resistance protein D